MIYYKSENDKICQRILFLLNKVTRLFCFCLKFGEIIRLQLKHLNWMNLAYVLMLYKWIYIKESLYFSSDLLNCRINYSF